MNPKEKQPRFGGGPSWLRLAEDKELEAAVDVAVAAADPLPLVDVVSSPWVVLALYRCIFPEVHPCSTKDDK